MITVKDSRNFVRSFKLRNLEITLDNHFTCILMEWQVREPPAHARIVSIINLSTVIGYGWRSLVLIVIKFHRGKSTKLWKTMQHFVNLILAVAHFAQMHLFNRFSGILCRYEIIHMLE